MSVIAAEPAAPSLHAQILADIERRIVSGEWPPGHRIPYEHELTNQYKCSRMTVSKALLQLVRAGLLERRRKAGTFVTRPHSQSAVLEIRDVAAEVATLGLAYAYCVLERKARRATGADRLGAPAGAPVLDLTCRHDAGDRPFCHERRIISLVAVPEAAEETFAGISPGAWLLARTPWTSAEHRIRAAAADKAMARAIGLNEDAPCLVIERRTWIADRPITHVTLTYPAEAHELVASFTPART